MNSNDFGPKVSIIIPVYNGSNYLREAVDSALDQTYSNIEILVVNDGSNDGGKTERIAKSYGNRIKYLFKKNGGVSSALNLGISNMTGEYFSWLSHDDVYYQNKIEEQITFLENFTNDDVIIYSDYELIDGNSEFIRNVRLKKVAPKKMLTALLYESFMHACTLLIPQKCFQDEKPFNESLKSTQDYDLLFRLAMNYNFVHLDKILIKSRQHSRQGSRTFGRSHKKESNDFFISSIRHLERKGIEYFVNNSKSLYFATLSYTLFKRGYYYPTPFSVLMSIKTFGFEDISRAARTVRKSSKHLLR